MKVKNSFITNSSSTSYILNNSISGKIKVKIPIDITNNFRELISSEPLTFDGFTVDFEITDYSNAHFLSARFESDFNELYYHVYIGIYMRYATDYSEPSQDVVYITLETNYVTSTIFEELQDLQILPFELISRIVKKMAESKSEFVYHKIPTDMLSGGWDGGDAMGSYQETSECLRNELEIGTITVSKDGEYTFNSKSLVKKKKIK